MNKNKVIHNWKTWFKTYLKPQDGIVNPIDYFNLVWPGNRIGDFKVPASTARQFNTDEALAKLFNALVDRYINLAVKLKNHLKMIPFSVLDEEDRDKFIDYVLEQVQFAVTNRQIMQKVSAASVSTAGFTVNVDTTPWGAFTSDMLSTEGQVLLQNTNIDDYGVVLDPVTFIKTQNGNCKVIGKFKIEEAPDIVWDVWEGV